MSAARMNRNQYEVARRARIVAHVEAEYPDDTPAQRAATVEDAIADEMADEAADRAYELDTFGSPEDTPCIQSADLWGTGEGQYHGIIQ